MAALVLPTSVTSVPSPTAAATAGSNRSMTSTGRGQHHDGRATEPVRQVGGGAIERAIPEGGGQARLVPPDPHDFARQTPRARGLGHRPAEQADTDDGETLDHVPLAARTDLEGLDRADGSPPACRR